MQVQSFIFHFNGQYVAVLLQSCPTLCDPIDGSPTDFPSLGFSRQEHWSGLPFPSPNGQYIMWQNQSIWIRLCIYECSIYTQENGTVPVGSLTAVCNMALTFSKRDTSVFRNIYRQLHSRFLLCIATEAYDSIEMHVFCACN